MFGAFVLSESAIIRPIGFALAFGVLVDAFIVRLLLMPALMSLTGDWPGGSPAGWTASCPMWTSRAPCSNAGTHTWRPTIGRRARLTGRCSRRANDTASGHHAAVTIDPSWRELPPRALAFRLAHIAWGIVAMGALANVWLHAVRRSRSRLLWAGVAMLGVQVVGLIIGRGDCPLGPFQRKLGDPIPMFELALSPRAAKAAIPVLVAVGVAGLIALLLRPPRRGPDVS